MTKIVAYNMGFLLIENLKYMYSTLIAARIIDLRGHVRFSSNLATNYSYSRVYMYSVGAGKNGNVAHLEVGLHRLCFPKQILAAGSHHKPGSH